MMLISATDRLTVNPCYYRQNRIDIEQLKSVGVSVIVSCLVPRDEVWLVNEKVLVKVADDGMVDLAGERELP